MVPLAGYYPDLRSATLEVAYLEGLAPWGDDPWRTVARGLLERAQRHEDAKDAEVEALQAQVETDEEALTELREEVATLKGVVKKLEGRVDAVADHRDRLERDLEGTQERLEALGDDYANALEEVALWKERAKGAAEYVPGDVGW